MKPRTKEEFYALAGALAQAVEMGGEGVPVLELPPRPPSPTARRAQVEAAVAELCAELDRVLSRKVMAVKAMQPATAGRLLVQRGEKVGPDGVYTPGPGLKQLMETIALDGLAEIEKENAR